MARGMGRATRIDSILLWAFLLVSVILTGCGTAKSSTGTPLPERPVARQAQPQVLEAAPPLLLQPVDARQAWVSVESWRPDVGLKPLTGSNSPAAYALGTSVERMLTLIEGTRQAKWNGIGCWLGFAPQLLDGVLHVHDLDARKNLLPLLAASFWRPPHGGTIVVDPGHGGRDPGARNLFSGAAEKGYNLDWALRLRPLLQAQGWKVILTRDRDLELALSERVRIADQHQADLFISLHFNSGEPNRTLKGIETYCLTPSGMPSTLQRFEGDNPTQQWPNNGFDAENIQIAQRIHHALVQATGADDRGVRRARFMTVLREQQRPAILIEGGYLSNGEESARIDSAEYRQTLAGAVARGLW